MAVRSLPPRGRRIIVDELPAIAARPSSSAATSAIEQPPINFKLQSLVLKKFGVKEAASRFLNGNSNLKSVNLAMIISQKYLSTLPWLSNIVQIVVNMFP